MTQFSVIVPTYKRNDRLCKTLRCWLAQDFDDFEMIVVDQSPLHDETTSAFLKSIENKIIYITSETPNLPAARNLGIRASQGQTIVFCDDDISVGPETLTALAESFIDPSIRAVTGFVIFEELPQRMITNISHKQHYGSAKKTKELIPVNDFIGGFMSFRRSLFDQVGEFDEWVGSQRTAAGEDFEFSQRAKLAGIQFFLNPSIEVVHEINLAGGCGKAEMSIDERKFLSNRMAYYAYLKNSRGIVGYLAAILKCYRATVLNRSILNLNPLFHIERHLRFVRALRFAIQAARHQPRQSALFRPTQTL